MAPARPGSSGGSFTQAMDCVFGTPTGAFRFVSFGSVAFGVCVCVCVCVLVFFRSICSVCSVCFVFMSPSFLPLHPLPFRQMYCSSDADEPEYALQALMRQVYEPLFREYGVTMMIAGHVHKYERICAVDNGVCQPPGLGTVHIVAGMGGHAYKARWQNDVRRVTVPALACCVSLTLCTCSRGPVFAAWVPHATRMVYVPVGATRVHAAARDAAQVGV